MGDIFEIGRVYAATPPSADQSAVQTVAVVVDLWSLAILMGFWILVICAGTQAIKQLWVSYSIVKGQQYRRVVPLLPPLVGIVTGLAIADDVALALSFVLHWLAAAFMIGPVAGMLAGWAWIFGRRIVMPAVLAIAPAATRRALVGLLGRVGIDVADVADVSLDISRAELGLQESSGVDDDA